MNSANLAKKLSIVMSKIKRIPKNGYNAFHKYKFATESDVSDSVREWLSEQNITFVPSVISHTTREHTNAKGNKEYIATVMVQFTFMDGDSGETISFNMAGEGQDAGDKAVYKAITGATKYGLMKFFLIPTGDDPESDNGVDERNHGQRSQTQQSKPQQPASTTNQATKATVLAKWEILAGNTDEFEAWYNGQIQKGYNEGQMNALLTKKINEQKGTN